MGFGKVQARKVRGIVVDVCTTAERDPGPRYFLLFMDCETPETRV